MPVMPRTFITCKVASLSKSVECESLSLFVGRASSVTVCILAEHGGLEHYRMSTVGSTHRPFGPPPTVSTVTTMPTPMTSLPNAEVMIGNSITYPDTAHNQSLPIVTRMDMLAAQHHWCFWCFGVMAYQSLPIVTTSPHAVIGELGR